MQFFVDFPNLYDEDYWLRETASAYFWARREKSIREYLKFFYGATDTSPLHNRAGLFATLFERERIFSLLSAKITNRKEQPPKIASDATLSSGLEIKPYLPLKHSLLLWLESELRELSEFLFGPLPEPQLIHLHDPVLVADPGPTDLES